MVTSSQGSVRSAVAIIAIAAIASILGTSTVSYAAPNLIANGNLEQPPERAIPRVGPTGNEVIFEFEGAKSFGRVIAYGEGAADSLSKELAVGYVQQPGGSRGLLIDAKEINFSGSYDIEVWFDLKGKIRPNKEYAYSVDCRATSQNSVPTLKMIAPAMWTDGRLSGAVVELSWTGDEQTLDDIVKRGTIKTPDFKHRTGGQALVLKLPTNFKSQLFFVTVGFREMDEALVEGKEQVMPNPTLYIPVVDILAERIEIAKSGAANILRMSQNPQTGAWPGTDVESSVQITAFAMHLLAVLDEDLSAAPMEKGVRWLAEQEITKTQAIATRIEFLCTHALNDNRQTIASDVLALLDAQYPDGGWSEYTGEYIKEDKTIQPDNVSTLAAVGALAIADQSGFEVDLRTWRQAAAYWRNAQAVDGGFRDKMDKYGGLGEATTTTQTAFGLSGLLITLDMAYATEARTCSQYLASSAHLEAMHKSFEWLSEYYDEYYKMLPDLNSGPNPFANANAMVGMCSLSGITSFRDKNIFRTEAEAVLQYYDQASGTFAGNLEASLASVSALIDGSKPIVIQRWIMGGTADHEFSRDAVHLCRYLGEQRGHDVSWRAVDLSLEIEELVRTPILYVNVEGEIEASDEEWGKLRDYCFGGGVIVFNIAEDNEAARSKLEQELRKPFPEFSCSTMKKDDPILSIKHDINEKMDMKVLGNGLKNFIFITPQDWSCHLNNYQLTDHAETFQFLDNLLLYTLDSSSPRGNFEASTWSRGAVPTKSTRISHLTVGTHNPMFPDFLKTLDRIMQTEYRLKIDPIPAEASSTKTELLWLSCAGSDVMTDRELEIVRNKIAEGSFVFAEVLTGNTSWAETFRSDLQKLGSDYRIRRLLANHPVMTGELYETYGYDVRVINVRTALKKDNEKLPRLEMYILEKGDKEVGIFTVHDVGSGLGYFLYPECKGAMPEWSRKIAANIVLYAMQQSLEEG